MAAVKGSAVRRLRAVRDSGWLPLGALLVALSTVFLFVGERGHFYRGLYAGHTAKNLALTANLSSQHGFLFTHKGYRADGTIHYELYNRFPIGFYMLVKLATAPFQGDLFAQIVAARTLMLAFFCAAAVLAYLALAGMVGRTAALIATLLGFSSYHLLDLNDVVTSEMTVGLFGMMLVLRGMVRFRERGRFWQLAVKVCVALLLDWHVYGLLLPFLALGIVREARTGWGNVASAGTPLAHVLSAAGQALRSRSALLGALALLFGIGVLGYNLLQEHAGLEAPLSVGDLPSAKSMAKRIWAPPLDHPQLAWSTFVEWQLHRVGTMVLPFGLATGLDFNETRWRESGVSSLFWLGLVGTVGCLAGLALLSRRHRAVLAALALSGFCWALLVRGNTAWSGHQYESMFYVGVPLVLFAAVFTLAQRRWAGWAGPVGTAAAVVVFAGSSVAMGLTHRDPGRAQAGRALMGEYDAVTAAIHGKTVLLPMHRTSLRWFLPRRTFDVLTAGAFVQSRHTARLDTVPLAAPALDFVIAVERFDLPSLLTPSHRTVFLYEAGSDAGGVLQAMLAARRADWRLLKTAKLVARSAFDIRFVPPGRAGGRAGGREGERADGEGERLAREGGQAGGELAFLRTPCTEGDTAGYFYFRTRPVRTADMARWRSARPDLASWRTRPNRSFLFATYGDVFDDKCLLRVPLPRWPVANVRAGQNDTDATGERDWRVTFRLDWDRIRAARQAALASAPTAKGLFDVYMRNGELTYLRTPCGAEDTRSRFLLHVFQAASRGTGRFDNLDFDFAEHGALIDGGCVVLLTLPRKAAWVRTGQFDPDRGVIWQTEFAPPWPPWPPWPP